MFTKLIAVVAALCLSDSLVAPADVAEDESEQLRVLVLTGGEYHDFDRNTTALVNGISERSGSRFTFDAVHLGNADRSAIDLSESGVFDRYDAILAYYQGEFEEFTADVKRRFLRYMEKGGGLVAIHSAADSFPGWDEYDNMLGGRFESHPPFSDITVNVDVTLHEITRDLPTEWTLQDEFYHLKNCAEDDKLILMTGRSPGDDEGASPRPVAWERNYGAGRVFYTILGHGIETHSDERFHQLIANALKWSANAPKPNDDGEFVLFDGSSMDGWSMAGPGGFRHEGRELVAYGGMGMLWYHERRFRDFTLKLEWKTTRIEDNSGVFMRFHKPSNDPWYAVRHGHEIQILDDPNAGERRGTGSIYAYADAPNARDASNPPGQWNTYEITVKGDTYTVILNGKEILEWDSPAERHGREGYIGLQNHDDDSPVRFRNIRVKPLE
jgi:hypothetical protein